MSGVSADHAELVTEFSNVTGIEGDRAKFYLESAAWDLQMALASYYEDDGEDIEEIIERPAAAGAPPVPLPKPGNPSQPASRFATIGSLKKEESSDDDEGQAFYAGGSERSGQQVIGPGKKKKDNIIEEMFKSAQDHGAVMVGKEDAHPKSKLDVFQGPAYRLGASETDTSAIPSSSGTSTTNSQSQTTDIVLKFWKDGFSLDDGNLRDYQDPANQQFLTSIRSGEIPDELVHQFRGVEVTLNMEDHRGENFLPPKSKLKAFSGTGHKLGSPAPKPIFDKPPGQPDVKQSEQDANATIGVDSARPITNVQIRLADGSRLTASLNHTHTVGDLYRYITLARPQYSSSPFTLMTTFPNKQLDNHEETLKDASLLNAVIVQRLK